MTALKFIKTHINRIISFALAIAVIVIAVGQGRDLANALRQVRLGWAFAGLGCYGINYLLRAHRMKVILNDGIRMWPDAVYTACLHGLATYLLPFRSGEFTLPVILNKTFNFKFSDGARALLKARLLDLFAVGIWILLVALLIDFPMPAMVYRGWVILGIALTLFPLMLRWGGKQGALLKRNLWQRFSKWGAVASFDCKEVGISFGIWACVGACFFCTAQAIGLPLGFLQVWLLITIQLPLQLLPLQGVANAGNHEGGWIAGLALLGVSTDQGLHFALLSHALLLTYVLALAPSALLIRRF